MEFCRKDDKNAVYTNFRRAGVVNGVHIVCIAPNSLCRANHCIRYSCQPGEGLRTESAAASKRRMTAMLERVGIDPDIDSSGDTETILKEVRQRCRSCTSADVCDIWLAGGEVGGIYFCPNAKVFESLKRTIDVAA